MALYMFLGDMKTVSNITVKWKSSPDVQPDVDLVEKLQKDAPTVWALIVAANESVIAKAGRLSNETTNVAENLMSVINKYSCGKRISLGKAGSYQRRINIAGKYRSEHLCKCKT